MAFDAQPDSSGPLGFVDVRFGAAKSSLDFSGGLAGVLTESSERSEAARRIATTVMGPRPAEDEASADFAARLATAAALPSKLAPSGPGVLGRDDLRGHWQAVCARRRDDLAAVHASRRLERHRIEAALEQARARESGAVESPGAALTASEAMQLRTRIHSLLLAVEALAPVPSPEALQLADAWDVHTELVHARAARPAVEIAGAEERVKLAQISLAMNSGGVHEDARAEIDRRHREVVEAEANLFEARRKERPEAAMRYEAAVAAEKAALTRAGIDSYASFLFAITGGNKPLDTDLRRAAHEELTAACDALDAARQLGQVATDSAFHARGVALRAHAERLLGRVVVDGDPPAELRALRIEAPGRAERSRLLADALEAAGVAVHGDVVATARRLLTSNLPEPVVRSGEPVVRSGEVEALERKQAQHERDLAELEAEIARVDEIRRADMAGTGPDDLVLIMDSVLKVYRAANLLGSRLAVVLDGALDGLATDARQAALLALARAGDVQSIVVTDDLQVMKSVAQVGGTIVLWSEPEQSDSDVAPSQWSDA